MTDRAIASRPSLEQVVAIVDFMENHPALALGQLRGLEGRDESKKLWLKLTRIVNNINGPTRPMKSWVKYWADKKSTVRAKVMSLGGDPNSLGSNIEKKIWDLFLNTNVVNKSRKSVKLETHFVGEDLYNNEDSMELNDSDPMCNGREPEISFEERQNIVLEKVVKAMSEQSSALAQLALASNAHAQAMERLAEASHIQASAIERLANSFETISASTHDVRLALVDIDSSMKRFYSASTT